MKDPIFENPHIVETIQFTVGRTPVVVRFADNCYRDAPKEEIERHVQDFLRASQKSWERQQLDKLQAQKIEAG